MKVKPLLFFLTAATFSPFDCNAQFFTIEREETNQVKRNVIEPVNEPGGEDYFYSYQDSLMKHEPSNKDNNVIEDFFSTTDGHEVSIERDIPVFVNLKDSLLLGLIRKRMDICLPLDYISVNSKYGWRKDPFSKCTKFHDGIDLKCNYQHVYSMLPGTVVKTVYSNKGYGNHIVIDYGHIQILYGHLSAITVRPGEDVYAGTIIGVSGSSGKSSGPHLHIRISSDGKSLNPAPFIAYLNKYITSLQDKIAYLRFGERPPQELNIASLYEALRKYNVMYPKIVVAQALLETAYFSSNVCLNYNNLFGLRRPSNGAYYRFDNWEESVKAYKDFIQYKYHGGDYLRFLKRINYAEDPAYINKVRSIANAL